MEDEVCLEGYRITNTDVLLEVQQHDIKSVAFKCNINSHSYFHGVSCAVTKFARVIPRKPAEVHLYSLVGYLKATVSINSDWIFIVIIVFNLVRRCICVLTLFARGN